MLDATVVRAIVAIPFPLMALCAVIASGEARADHFQLECKGEISASGNPKIADHLRVDISSLKVDPDSPEAWGLVDSDTLGRSDIVTAYLAANKATVSGKFLKVGGTTHFTGSINFITASIRLTLNDGADTWEGDCAKAQLVF
jgi:hypothetical protein